MHSKIRYAGMSLLAIGLVGCAGNNSQPFGSGTVEMGRAALNNAFAASQGSRSSQFESAITFFNDVLLQEPNNPQASMGYATAQIGWVLELLGEAFGDDPFRSRESRVTTFPSNLTSLLSFWNNDALTLGRSRGNTMHNLFPVFSLASVKSRPTREFDPAAVEAALIAADARLALAENRLNDVIIALAEQSPITITLPFVGERNLGSVEGYVIRGAVRAARGLINGSLAYRLSATTANPDASFASAFETQLQAGGTLTPAQYLFGENFLTVKEDGGDRLDTLEQKLGQGGSDIMSALQALGQREGTGWWFMPEDYSQGERDEIAASVNKLFAALEGPVPVEIQDSQGNPITVQMNLRAWTDQNMPNDLKASFPTIDSDPMEDGYHLTKIGGSSDATFGGLFPNGIPNDPLYAGSMHVTSSTTVGDVAAWAISFSN